MYCTMTPISSMWPSSRIVGEPPGFTSAMLLPVTSVVTLANEAASSRQTRAAGPSKPEGAGVSSNRLRKASEDVLSIAGAEDGGRCAATRGRLALHRASSNRKRQEANGEDHEPGDVPADVFGEPVVEDAEPGDHLPEKPAVQAVRQAGRTAAAPR